MKLTEKLIAGSKDIWAQYLESPIVKQMADGTLDPHIFHDYLLQDYVYLRDYIKIFAVCITKTDDYGMIRFMSENIKATLDELYRVHVPYMKKLGITEDEIASVEPHINSVSYSHYMICEAQSGNLLTGLVELLDCSWSYAFIAENMVSRYPSAVDHELYGQWFSSYICDEYKGANQSLIDMVDELGESISEKETDRLCSVFRTCSTFELRFWDIPLLLKKQRFYK